MKRLEMRSVSRSDMEMISAHFKKFCLMMGVVPARRGCVY